MLQGSAEQGKKGLLLYWKYLALKKITHTHYLLVAKFLCCELFTDRFFIHECINLKIDFKSEPHRNGKFCNNPSI